MSGDKSEDGKGNVENNDPATELVKALFVLGAHVRVADPKRAHYLPNSVLSVRQSHSSVYVVRTAFLTCFLSFFSPALPHTYILYSAAIVCFCALHHMLITAKYIYA